MGGNPLGQRPREAGWGSAFFRERGFSFRILGYCGEDLLKVLLSLKIKINIIGIRECCCKTFRSIG